MLCATWILSCRHVCSDVATPAQVCRGNDNVLGYGPCLRQPVRWVVVWRGKRFLSCRHICPDVVTPGRMCGGNENVFGLGSGLRQPLGWVVVWAREMVLLQLARLPGCGHAWADVRWKRERLRLWTGVGCAGVSGHLVGRYQR
jgi:hypothetical protein